jgi:N-acetylmuramoyl-L-alanine amidase
MKKFFFGSLSVLIILLTIYCGTSLFLFSSAFSYYGSRSTEVLIIQTKLKEQGYYKGNLDSIYGYQTYRAVKHFQLKNNLKIDGICGQDTLGALGISSKDIPSISRGDSNRNLWLLASIVHGEARGEPYIGQVAVAAVVLNRVKDGRFPKSISGVIYQKGAFDAISDGQFYISPNDSAYKAATEAMNGYDPSGGAIYYYNPNTATDKWIWTRTVIKVIGNHCFAK